jgi:hypothetical protein
MSTEVTPIPPGNEVSVSPPVGLTPLSDLSSQINNNHRRADTLARSSFEYAQKCGKALREAKAQVGHGGWLPWLARNCPDLSARRAQKYMQINEHWPQIEEALGQDFPETITLNGVLALIGRPNTPSGRICQQTGLANPEHTATEDATGESSRSRVSGNPEAAAVDVESKQSALIQPSVPATVTTHLRPSGEIIEVSVAKLTAHKAHFYVYQDAPDQELVDSIQQFGIFEPLIVASRGEVIVSGHRRWEAAKLLDMDTVPVVYITHRYQSELALVLIECNRKRVNTSNQKEKEARQLTSAYSDRRYWDDRNLRKAAGKSAEPQE